MEPKVLEKIKKLMALSQSDNPNEAALAMDKASELMQQHQVSIQDVELSSIGEYMVKMANMSKKQPEWHAILINVVAEIFGVEPMIIRRIEDSALSFIGIKDRIEVAAYCYTVLSRKVIVERKRYIGTLSKRMKPAKKTARADVFCKGWVIAVEQNVARLGRSDREKRLVDEYMEINHQDRSISCARKGKKHMDSLIAGIVAGSDVQVHHGVDGKQTMRIGHAQ